MSTLEDEARAEAARLYPHGDGLGESITISLRSAYRAGAEFAASRREPSEPPIYLALDLWMALGMDSRGFDGYYERNGWATTWSVLLDAVRTADHCEMPITMDEDCVLRTGHIGPHMGPSDVGSSEPLPRVPEPSDTDEREWEYTARPDRSYTYISLARIRDAHPTPERVYRRRKAGPWEVVPDAE
jgi:hypothetical protein